MQRIVLTCALAWLLAVSSFAQETQHIPELLASDTIATLRLNTIGIGLERNLNTFNWVGQALIDTTAWGTAVKMSESFTSNTILLDGGQTSSHTLRSDQQNLTLRLRKPLTTTLSSEAQWASLVYSDNKSIGLGQATFHSVLGGIEYYPLDIFSVNPLVGYRWDEQAGRQDKGMSFTLGAQTHGIDLDGYQLAGSVQLHGDRLNPRVLERHLTHVGIQKYFSGKTRDSIDVGYSRNRREFYTITTGNIESRIEDALFFSNLLDYEFEPRVLTSLFVNVFSRTLQRNTRQFMTIADSSINTTIDEFRLEAYIQSMYRSYDGGLVASIRLGHGERSEQHSASPNPYATTKRFTDQRKIEESKNNLASRTSLGGLVRLPLSTSDTLSFSGTTSILRYDTPAELSPENRVDRDELLVALSVSSTHRISQYLDLGLAFNGNLSHVVYLFGAWSANNNYNRVLRLSPTATYRPTKTITSINTFEVLANYTVYDFEQQVSGVRSYSFRQFGWVDSSSIQFTRRIGLDCFAHVRLYERGQLQWSDFSERTENSYVDRTIASQIRFSPREGILFAVGARHFSQSRYAFAGGVKMLDLFIRSFGPTCLIRWDIGVFSKLAFEGWYEQRTFAGSQMQQVASSQSLPNLSMNITINL